MNHYVDVLHLTKSFATQTAIDDLTLAIPGGQIVGLVGHNGAGKTTALNLLSGVLRPDRGSVKICGHDLASAPVEAKRRLGYAPEGGSLFESLTGREYIVLVASLYSLESIAVDSAFEELRNLFEMPTEILNRKLISAYSKGNKQKLLLISALLHSPPVLLLDEPFDGLDVQTVSRFIPYLRARATSGCSIIYSSHDLSTIQQLCDRIVLLRRGRVVMDGAIDGLAKQYGSRDLKEIVMSFRNSDDNIG